MDITAGFGPAVLGSSPGGCTKIYVRPGRIELPTEHWQCPVIPLNHGRNASYSLIIFTRQQFFRK